MIETALLIKSFAENAKMTASRASAVLLCIAQNIYRKGEQRNMKMIDNEMNVTVPLEIIKASEIEPKKVKWLWYPYIPFGKVTLLQGDPGDGKSKLMLSIAALLSKGEPLPFTETEKYEPMTIIYQTTEDDADDTVVPRFNSADGNGENLIFIKEDEKTLSFGDNRIREAIEKYNAKLLILDPLSFVVV
jgi:RecA-family ATPase